MLFEKEFGDLSVSDPVYPKAIWNDGIPRNEKEAAEIAAVGKWIDE